MARISPIMRTSSSAGWPDEKLPIVQYTAIMAVHAAMANVAFMSCRFPQGPEPPSLAGHERIQFPYGRNLGGA